jgi:DNA repair protein RadA/Sms
MNICRVCKFELVAGRNQCPSCGAWNLVKPSTQELELVTLADEDEEGVSKICPDTWWGKLLSGGLPDSSSILFSGDAGAGKSTTLLQMALSCIKATKKAVIYLALEERGAQIKPRAKRVGYKHRHLERVVLMHQESIDEELECLEQFSHEEVCLLAVDSLSALANRNEEQAANYCQLINEFSKDTGIPSILIDHTTKSNTFAGLQALQHFVDITVYIRTHQGLPRRTWTTEKNRFGQGQLVGEICMSEAGILVPMVLDAKTGEYILEK